VRAVVIERKGGPEVLELQERPTPEPGPGEVLVDVGAIGVNYRDVYERTIDKYAGPPPRILGVEGAGTVTALGAAVEEFRPGDRVVWKDAPGSYAEQVVVAAERAVPVPDGVSDEQAAAALLQGMTAQYLSSSTYPVAADEWVVVHAGAGGVGLLLTQMVKLRSGRVLATTSTEEKAELARQAGADEVARYEDFVERGLAITGDVGMAAVYDGVGATTFEAGLAVLRARGMMVLYGSASGPAPALDPSSLASRSLYLTRPTLEAYTATREELLHRAEAVFGLVAAGKLDVRIGGRYSLEHARQAHEDLQSRRTAGNLLLLPR
jgi:NADPH2:quinone reductase